MASQITHPKTAQKAIQSTYASAGVNIAAGNTLVNEIKADVASTAVRIFGALIALFVLRPVSREGLETLNSWATPRIPVLGDRIFF